MCKKAYPLYTDYKVASSVQFASHEQSIKLYILSYNKQYEQALDHKFANMRNTKL